MSVESKKNISLFFEKILLSMWLDIEDESVKETPRRFAKMIVDETCRWLFTDPPKITTFPNTWDAMYDWMIVVKDIEVKSLCEHHFQPFCGVAHVAYIPWDRMVWLSKFSRVVDYWSRRPQVQERLTTQIFNHLVDVLDSDNIAVVLECEHFCMKLRWVEEHASSTTTAKLWWLFFDDAKCREEFYFHISQWKK